jgi:hypothetical protein
MIQYWLQNDSGTVNVRLDDSKRIALTDGFALTDYVGETAMVKENWRLWLHVGHQENGGRVAQMMAHTETLNAAWRIASDAIVRREAENMVWLYQRRHGVERRVLLTGGRATYSSGDTWPASGNNWAVADVEVTRHPLVEDVPLVTVTGTAVSCTGGTLAITKPGQLYSQTTAVSIAPARLADVIFSQPSGAGPDIDTVWAGIHPGGTTTLVPSLTLITGDGAFRMDGGTGSTISFSPYTEHRPRMKTSVGVNTGDQSQLRGRWRVLLRAKTTGGTNLVSIQMGVGDVYTDQYAELATDFITTGGAWQLLEMGEIELPPEGYTPFATLGSSNNYAGIGLFLLAGCENSAVSLQLDRFILIPARHMLKATSAQIQKMLFSLGDPRNWDDRGLHCVTQPDDTQQAVSWRNPSGAPANQQYPAGLVPLEPINWLLPPEGGVLVVAATRANNVHDTADTLNLRLEYHPRHYTL